MVNWKSRKLGDWLLLGNGVALIVLINLASQRLFYRVDLTDEKRFSLKEQTRSLIGTLEDKVYIEVFLEGDLNPGFQRFRKAIAETLEEFRIYSDSRVTYTFVDPAGALGAEARREFMADLASKGIQPINVIDNESGQRNEKLIFPGAVISAGGLETGVMLLKGNLAGGSSDERINQSIEGIEFELTNAIYRLTSLDRPAVGLVVGHQEISGARGAAMRQAIAAQFDLIEGTLQDQRLLSCDAIVIAKPRTTFSVEDKYALDQFIMNGGNALFMVDKLHADTDSATMENYFAFPYNLDLDDLLFKYGVRLNMDLIEDRSASFTPVVTGSIGNKPQIQMLPWPYYPLINRYADHVITRNLDAVVTRFVSTVDTVKATGIRKTPLMFTSPYSKRVAAPVRINFDEVRRGQRAQPAPGNSFAIGYLLEGKFQSIYKNRFLPESVDASDFRAESAGSKIIVIADGDLVVNDVNASSGQPYPLGFDRYTNYTFSNEALLLNMLSFLTEENGIITARNKEVRIRPLDRERVQDEKIQWQIINVGLPVLLIVLLGIVKSVLRKRKYAAHG